MKFINLSGNTVEVEDLGKTFPFKEDMSAQEIDIEDVKKSRSFRNMILLGQFKPIDLGDSLFEKNLIKLKNNIDSIPKKVKKEESHTEKSEKIEVKIKGHFFEAGGYAKVNRNMAIGLNRVGIKTQINPVTNAVNDLNESELRILASLRSPVSNDAVCIDSIIPSFSNIGHGKYKILYTTIEACTIPKQFVEISNNYNEIWVTSDFCKTVLSKYEIKRPIFVMPNSIDGELYNESVTPYEFNPSLKSFVFGSVFGWSYRKGYDALLRAYLSEFNGDDPVSLLIVSRFQSKSKRSDVVRDEIQKYIKEYGGKNPAHIARCSKVIPEKEMPNIYKSMNAYVLFSRGEGFGMPYCFKENTKIVTPKNHVNIQDVKVGDKIISGNGREKEVTEIHKNFVNCDFKSIKTEMTPDILEVTANHAFLAFKPDRSKFGKISAINKDISTWIPTWIRAKDLDNTYYLAYPLKKEWNNNIEIFDIASILDNRNFKYDKKYVWSKFSNTSYKKNGIIKLNRFISFDTELSKLLGYYASEGSLISQGNGVEFSFNANEENYHSEVVYLLYKIFNLKSKKIIKNNSCRIYCCSKILALLLDRFVGKGCKNKKVPFEVINNNKNNTKEFLNGIINGDGGSYSYLNRVSFTTTSENLARGYQKLMLDLGEHCSLLHSTSKNRDEWNCNISGYSLKEKWIERDKRILKSKITSTRYFNDDYVFIKIKYINSYNDSCYVYNFDVKEDHSYISNIVIAHNCEAAICGVPIISTNHSGQTMFLKADNSTLIDIDSLSEIQNGMMHVHYWDGQIFPNLTSNDFIERAGKSMREVFCNYKSAVLKNKALKTFLSENYNIDVISKTMKLRLENIWRNK